MREVTKFYGVHRALGGLDLEVDGGHVVGLLGLNGAGKTTCLRLLSGQESPTSGRILIGGQDLEASGPNGRADIGFLPQLPPVYPEMRVAAFLDFALALRRHHLPSARRRALVAQAMTACDLAPLSDSRIGALSDGMRRRVGIAQAVVHQPKVVLLDEPTAGLDPVQVAHVRRLIGSLAGQHTVVVSSHILEEIHRLCDVVCVLHEGALVARGSEASLAATLSAAKELVVEVQGSPSAIAQALADLPDLVSWRVVAPAAPDQDPQAPVSLLLQCGRDIRPQVAARLVGAGLGLCRLDRNSLGLENIFLALTGQGAP